MGPIVNLMNQGYNANAILQSLIRKYPQYKKEVNKALSYGYSAEKLLQYIIGGREEAMKPTTEFEEMIGSEAEKKSDRRKKTAQAALLAGGTVAGLGGLAALGMRGSGAVIPQVLPAMQQAAGQAAPTTINIPQQALPMMQRALPAPAQAMLGMPPAPGSPIPPQPPGPGPIPPPAPPPQPPSAPPMPEAPPESTAQLPKPQQIPPEVQAVAQKQRESEEIFNEIQGPISKSSKYPQDFLKAAKRLKSEGDIKSPDEAKNFYSWWKNTEGRARGTPRQEYEMFRIQTKGFNEPVKVDTNMEQQKIATSLNQKEDLIKQSSVSDDPAKWEWYSKDFKNNRKKESTFLENFKDYKIYNLEPDSLDSLGYLDKNKKLIGTPGQLVAVDENDNVIADLFYMYDLNKNHTDLEGAIEVNPNNRRQGVASRLYELGEKLTGKKFRPAPQQSLYAKEFWKNKNRNFGIKPGVPKPEEIAPEISAALPEAVLPKEQEKPPEHIQKVSKDAGSMVSLPDGNIGTIESIKNGIAKVNVDGIVKHRKLDDLEESPIAQKDLADIHDEMVKKMEEESGEEVSKAINLVGYDPISNKLLIRYHLGDQYTFNDIDKEDIDFLQSTLVKRKTTGENYIGPWVEGTQSVMGAKIHALVQKYKARANKEKPPTKAKRPTREQIREQAAKQYKKGGKASERIQAKKEELARSKRPHTEKYETVYDFYGAAAKASKEKKSRLDKERRAQEKAEKKALKEKEAKPKKKSKLSAALEESQ